MTKIVFSSIISFFLCSVLIPVTIILSNKYSLYDTIDKRKIHSGNISRLGGLPVVLSFFVGTLVYFLFLSENSVSIAFPFVLGGLIIFIMGVVDDFHSLRAKIKLLIQCIVAFIIVFFDYRFKSFLGFEVPAILGKIITFCWIVGIINSYNLIDGIDCLCGGLAFLTLGTLGLVFLRSAVPFAAICFILCGAILGFLLYNKPPAKIFLGDGGSQFLGFAVAVCPLFYSTPNYEYNKVLIMIVLVSIPMTDTLAALWRRKREHRSFFSPDRGHIHHKLINIGFSKITALIFLLAIQALICFSVGLAMYLQTFNGTILLLITYSFVLMFFSVLHYINRLANVQHKGNLPENPVE